MKRASFIEATERVGLFALVAVMAVLINLEWYAGSRVTQQTIPPATLVVILTLFWSSSALMNRLCSSTSAATCTLCWRPCIVFLTILSVETGNIKCVKIH